MIDVKELLTLNNFRQLGDIALLDIVSHSELMETRKGVQLVATELSDEELYLLDGEIEIKVDGRLQHVVKAGEERAQHPVFRIYAKGIQGCCTLPCRLLKVKQAYVKKYNIHRKHEQNEIEVEEIESPTESDDSQLFVTEVLEKFDSNEIELPSLPEIALHINSMLENDSISAQQLSATVQTDPIIAARIIKVSNSAMYGAPVAIESVQQAITRIGLQAVRAIVMSVVIRNLFKPRSILIKKTMARFYEHSIRTGVVCYGLANTLKGVNPDHGFLVGLLHDIGVIPILVVADDHPELSRQAGHLETVVSELKANIGHKLLHQWGFADEYANIALEAYDWNRMPQEVDYCDLVQTALLHSYLVGGEKIQGPELRELPAFTRLGLDKVDPTVHMKMLNELSQRTKELISMLCG